MELVTTGAEENASLMPPDVPASDVKSAPHPYDYAEVPLPLHKKMLCIVTLPLLVPLVLLRILLLLVLALLLVVVCIVFARCRFLLQFSAAAIGRLCLLAFGVWPGMLHVRKPAKMEPAPILAIAPHLGGLEAFVMMWEGLPRAIAMETYANMPVISALFHASGGIAVPVQASNDAARDAASKTSSAPRASAKVAPAPEVSSSVSGSDGAEEAPEASAAPPPQAAADASTVSKEKPAEKPSTLAVRKAIVAHKQTFDPSDPARSIPLAILPEGTTHNGLSLLKFFSGAFAGGGPVQPVLLSYPYTHFHAAFFGGSIGDHAFRLLVNPWQWVVVTYLPVQHPSAEESENADLYAENVRQAMAAAAGLPLSEYGAKELRVEYTKMAVQGKKSKA